MPGGRRFDVPVIPQVVVDTRVFLFAAAVSLVTGLLFRACASPAIHTRDDYLGFEE